MTYRKATIQKQSPAVVLKKKCLGKKSRKIHRKAPGLGSLFNKVSGLRLSTDTPTQMFSCEFCEIFNNIFFYGTPPVAGDLKWCDQILRTLSGIENVSMLCLLRFGKFGENMWNTACSYWACLLLEYNVFDLRFLLCFPET